MSEHFTKYTKPYKTVQETGQDVYLDVYLPDETQFGLVAQLSQQILAQASGRSSAEKDHTLPVLVFWHGGGLVSGHKAGWLPQWLFKDALDAGFIIISPNYCLLTPQNAHVIIQDISDVFKWIHSDLNDYLSRTSSQLANLDKICISGASAGGYVATLASLFARPRPKACALIYPAGGDMLTDMYLQLKTQPFIQQEPLEENSDKYRPILDAPPETHIYETALEGDEPRLSYLMYLLQHGVFLDHLTGIHGGSAVLRALPYTQRPSAVPKGALPVFPSLNEISSGHAPSFIIHGSLDSVVSVKESRAWQRKLTAADIECELLEFEGREHAFDLDYRNSSDCKGLEKMVKFLTKHV